MELMAVVSITLYVFVWVAFNKHTDKFEYGYVFFIFVFPWLFNWVPFTVDAFGRAGAWCWIRNEDIDTCEEILAGQILQFVLWYIATSVHYSPHIDRPLCRNTGQTLLLQATQVELEPGARRQLPTKENHQTDLVTTVVPLNFHLNQCGSSY
jgi:hypothetical protein